MDIKPNLNLSISYWNIEGLHDKIHGCKIPYLNKHLKSDIEILSETWGKCTHYNEIDNYDLIKIDTQKDPSIKKGRNSGGIIIYYKKYLSKQIKIIKKSINYIWIELDKSIFTKLNTNLRICIAYNPPEKSKYHKSELIDDITTDIIDMANNKHQILLIGDINGRTGTLDDYEVMKGNTSFSSLLEKNNPMISRNNCDKVINTQGSKIIHLCKTFDLMILNGRTSGDYWGNFTHYNNNKGASTVDLSIVSCNIYEYIKSFRVMPQLEITSHCKIITQIDNLTNRVNEEKDDYNWLKLPQTYKWNERSKERFINAINSDEITKLINEAEQLLEAGLIESSGNKIQEFFIKTADISSEKKCSIELNNNKKKKKSKSKKKMV